MEAANTSRHCPSCNVMVRPQAAFCHRCGRQVAPVNKDDVEFAKAAQKSAASLSEPPAVRVAEENVNGNYDFAKTFVEKPEESETVVAAAAPALSEAESGVLRRAPAEIEENSVPGESENAKLKPKTRRVVKPTEYVWEESDSDPTWRLVLFAVLAVVFVGLIFWLAHLIK